VDGGPNHRSVLNTVLIPLNRTSCGPPSADDIRRSLANAVSGKGMDMSDLRVSVSGKGAIVRHTDMPRMSLDDLKSSIKYEADMLLPFSLEESVFDCHILDPEDRGKARMKVVLAAAGRTIVQERIDMLKGMNLVPRLVSIDSIALANAFGAAAPQEGNATVSLLHIGAVRSILNVVSENTLELTRDIDVGGDSATLAIARDTGADFREAERRKEAYDASFKEMVSPMIMILARELKSTFNYFSSKMNKRITHIYLSGGGALWPDLKEAISSALGTPASLWDPLGGIGGSSKDHAGKSESGVALAVAAGLAVSTF